MDFEEQKYEVKRIREGKHTVTYNTEHRKLELIDIIPIKVTRNSDITKGLENNKRDKKICIIQYQPETFYFMDNTS